MKSLFRDPGFYLIITLITLIGLSIYLMAYADYIIAGNVIMISSLLSFFIIIIKHGWEREQ